MQLHTTARKKFGRFKKQPPLATRQLQSNENEAVKVFRYAWERYGDVRWSLCLEDRYKIAVDLVGDFRASAHDVGLMIAAAADLEAKSDIDHMDKVGFLISAFINGGSDSTYGISTHHLPVPPRGLGQQNTKNLIIHGNGLRATGCYMKSGTIMIYGDAGSYTGDRMKGGTIIVEGNTDGYTGLYMAGGEIIMKGSFGESLGMGMCGGTIIAYGGLNSLPKRTQYAGQYMHGGEIHICGHYPYSFELSEVNGGKIYCQGYLVVDK